MNFKDQYIPRFNPDGECTLVAMDYIYTFFYSKQANEERIRQIKSIMDILNYLSEINLNFLLVYSSLSMLSPYFWVVYLKYRDKVIVENKYLLTKKSLLSEVDKYVILIEESAKKLYGIENEMWSHFVVLYHIDGEERLFDPLKSILDKEYDFPLLDYSKLSEDQMECSALLKILIYK